MAIPRAVRGRGKRMISKVIDLALLRFFLANQHGDQFSRLRCFFLYPSTAWVELLMDFL